MSTTTEAAKAERWADKLRLELGQDIHAIQDMYPRLQAQAFYASTSTDTAEVEAMNLHGPASRLAAWEAKYETAEAEAAVDFAKFESKTGGRDYAGDQLNWELHPLGLMASWEDVVRDALGTPTTKRATVKAAGDYLYSAINWMLDKDENGDVNFIQADHLADELKACRSMLENILKEGDRADTGAPCVTCDRPLIRVWGETERFDHWKCKPCKDTVSPERYKNAVRADYLAHADKLTATDMAEAYGIKAGTLIVWAKRGKVRKHGIDGSGRRLYDVDDAVRCHDAKVCADADTPVTTLLGDLLAVL